MRGPIRGTLAPANEQQPGRTTVTTDPTLGLHSLATMARVLGRSQPLSDVLEVAAEGARLTLGAASVSISRYQPEDAALHTVINVGDLGPNEVRWPSDETYPVTRWPELAEVLRYGATRVDQIDDPQGDPRERDLLTSLGKGSSVTASVIVDERVWGEFYATRHLGHTPFAEQSVDYVEVLVALLGGAISRSLREADLVQRADR
jgi:GAF domain-containing protein